METEPEILSEPEIAPLSLKAEEKRTIREASAKLRELLKGHLAARKGGTSPLVAIAARIAAREQEAYRLS